MLAISNGQFKTILRFDPQISSVVGLEFDKLGDRILELISCRRHEEDF